MRPGITASDYVLGELTPEERTEAEHLLREDGEFRAQVEELLPVVERLEALPEAGWEGVGVPVESDELLARRRKRMPQLRPALAVAASLLLFAVGVAAGAALFGDTESDGGGDGTAAGEQIALEPLGPAANGAAGTGRFAPGVEGEAAVEVSGLAQNRPGEFYELWLLGTDGAFISLGSFRVSSGGDADLRVPIPVDPQLYRFLDVSLERIDEGPEHSGISVLRGPLS